MKSALKSKIWIENGSTPHSPQVSHCICKYICITEANNAILPNSIILFLALLNGAEESSKAGVVGRLSTNRTFLTESHLILKRDIESLFQVWSKKIFLIFQRILTEWRHNFKKHWFFGSKVRHLINRANITTSIISFFYF